jgi:hypothetical protein
LTTHVPVTPEYPALTTVQKQLFVIAASGEHTLLPSLLHVLHELDENGVNIHHTDNGHTPLHTAALHGHSDMIAALIRHGKANVVIMIVAILQLYYILSH